MSNAKRDRDVLRPLAQRYAEIAALDVQQERLDRFYRTISMREVRPVVLIDEVPWGEIRDEELRLRCEGSEARQVEQEIRRVLYQWDHFQVDRVIPPAFPVRKEIDYGSIGIEIEEIALSRPQLDRANRFRSSGKG